MVFEQVNFVEVINSLERQGFYDVALPFILIFTLIFAVLQKIQLFGSESRKFNAVISLAIAFFTVRVVSIVTIINTFLPKVSLVVLFLIVLLIMLGIFGSKPEGMKGGYLVVGLIIAVGGIVWSFVSSLPDYSIRLPYWLRITSTDIGYLTLAAIIIIVIMILGKKEDDNKDSMFKKLGQSFGEDKFGR